ncbi:photosynthetic reaction center cytochrome PufC [Novosphingobium sp. SG720]|uniref:photosynthetic reaction center cytochrome PufC n=1 Tax=Novosphingobium sp. SG720 TaxID=2586998 RepID=UPI0014461934|nr:photosynthetic reaction center cytochrome PufC [Novosphingobium sp. SG720]NKJ44218.1 photosynthetic reaction center cytochrome c subunit [Novosphingobium sp. SG720]
MRRITAFALATLAALSLGGCELAHKVSGQNGYRGTGMDQVTVKKVAMAKDEVPPPPYDPPSNDGPRARESFQNVQVLGDESAEQLSYTMAAITAWVAPKEGCNYCHNPNNMASDELYTKVVARRMLQMTRNINHNWGAHVGQTGVTCYTCHRGQAVPAYNWALPPQGPNGIIGNRHGQDNPIDATGFSALPQASLALYLTGDPKRDQNIRVQSTSAHPSPADKTSVMQTENSYAVMVHVSKALGVNCTFCHNAQSFGTWPISTPKRAKAWYGIRMVREANGQYIGSLANVFPAYRKGPMGDPLKVSCATCHQGKNKPLGGYPMARDYHALWGAPGPNTVPATLPRPLLAPPPAQPVASAAPARANPAG